MNFPFPMQSIDHAFILGSICIVGGLIWFFIGVRIYLRRRLICQTPTSKVQSAALGTVELVGKVGEAPLSSPLCQAPCAYYRYMVEEQRKGHKNRKYWATILEGESSEPFYLEDDTGRMLINPEGAKIDIPRDYCETLGGLFSDIPLSIQNFVQSQGHETHGWFGGEKKMRFSEWRLELHDPLFVFGTLVERCDLPQRSNVPHENLVVQHEGRCFLISDTCEKGQLNRLLIKSLAGILFGGAIAIAGLIILFNKVGLLHF